MLTAHKPGIVPLRPLLFGDILDGAVKAVRFNPKTMVGLSALVLALFLVPSAALAVGATHLTATSLSRLGPEAQAFLGIPAVLLQAVSTTLATAILSGLLIHVVGQAVLGRKPDIGQTWRAARGRVVSLVVLMILAGLFSLLSMAFLIGPGVLLLVNDNTGAGVILLVVGFLGLFVVSVFVSTKISLAAPAIVLEGHGALAGVRRSFGLTKGAAFSGQGNESGQLIVTFVSHLSALLTGAITTPFVAAVTGLIYIDRRMRLEALDVVLLRESQTNPAPPV